jgi:hypothetical protein
MDIEGLNDVCCQVGISPQTNEYQDEAQHPHRQDVVTMFATGT